MKSLCKLTTLNETVLRKSFKICNSHSTGVQSIPTVPLKNRPLSVHRVVIIMLQKWKVLCCITPVTYLILKYSSAALLSTTNIIMELARESSNSLKHKRPKSERVIQRECMASDIPVGWKGEELLAALYGQICTAGSVLPFSADSRTLLFREGRSRFVFLWEKTDPLPFQKKAPG